MREIRINIKGKEFIAKLNDTRTAKAIYDKLPIKSKVNLWGDEIYFRIPLKLSVENATVDVNEKDMAYWPEGNCFCIFFGPTPESKGKKPIPASAVNPIGKIKCNIEELKDITQGQEIEVNVK